MNQNTNPSIVDYFVTRFVDKKFNSKLHSEKYAIISCDVELIC